MLHSEIPYLQHECGALWDGFYLSPIGHEVDLRKKESVIANENSKKQIIKLGGIVAFQLHLEKNSAILCPISSKAMM